MPKLSLNKAHKEAKVAKSTLLEALRSGRLTGSKNDKGHYEIDPAELFRVFPKTGSEPIKEPLEKPKPTPQENHIETSILQAKLEVMAERHADAQKTIEDLRRRLDDESQERRETQRVLTHMKTEKAPAEGKGFFGFLKKG